MDKNPDNGAGRSIDVLSTQVDALQTSSDNHEAKIVSLTKEVNSSAHMLKTIIHQNNKTEELLRKMYEGEHKPAYFQVLESRFNELEIRVKALEEKPTPCDSCDTTHGVKQLIASRDSAVTFIKWAAYLTIGTGVVLFITGLWDQMVS